MTTPKGSAREVAEEGEGRGCVYLEAGVSEIGVWRLGRLELSRRKGALRIGFEVGLMKGKGGRGVSQKVDYIPFKERCEMDRM